MNRILIDSFSTSNFEFTDMRMLLKGIDKENVQNSIYLSAGNVISKKTGEVGRIKIYHERGTGEGTGEVPVVTVDLNIAGEGGGDSEQYRITLENGEFNGILPKSFEDLGSQATYVIQHILESVLDLLDREGDSKVVKISTGYCGEGDISESREREMDNLKVGRYERDTVYKETSEV